MTRHSSVPFTRCVFLPYSQRKNVPKGALVYDVSSYGDHPYCLLSPMWAHGGIPIPGMPGQMSDSVEGIWQGLKVLRGQIAPRFFKGKGAKRGGKPSGHLFRDKELGYVEARQKIYKVAYEWMLVHKTPDLVEQFVARAFEGVTQYFHDLEDNGNMNDTDSALAHASILVQYINRLCTERPSGLNVD